MRRLFERFVQPRKFGLRIVGDEPVHAHARLMQHDMTDRDAIRQSVAAIGARTVGAKFRLVQFGNVEQRAMRHHFGQHHGDGLQRLDFFLVIGARRTVLHGQDADRPARRARWARRGTSGYGSSPVSGR